MLRERYYLASIDVKVTALLLQCASVVQRLEDSSVKNPGSFGWGSVTPSLPNMETTDDIVGLSSGAFCTHKRPTCMHLNSTDETHE